MSARLYDILSTDNGQAANELGNALFGLRCTLDDCGRQATETSLQKCHDENQIFDVMDRNLDIMIAFCAATLTEIEKLFVKYVSEGQGVSGSASRIAPTAELSVMDKLRMSLSRLQKPSRSARRRSEEQGYPSFRRVLGKVATTRGCHKYGLSHLSVVSPRQIKSQTLNERL